MIQGDIKGPDGKPIKGAEVRYQRKDDKNVTGSTKTDGQGRYTLKNLVIASYTLSVSANGMATTSAENVKARSDGAVSVNFDLKKQSGAQTASTTKKKAKHMVWMPATTGSNLGGRWVEVEDNSSTPGSERVEKMGGTGVKNMQNNSGVNQHPGGGN